MKTLITALLALFCLPTSLLAQKPQDFHIEVANGSFDLKNVTVRKGETFLVRGDIVNNTTSDWGNVTFNMSLYDQRGQPLPYRQEYLDRNTKTETGTTPILKASFSIHPSKKGLSQRFEEQLDIYTDVKGAIGKFDIVFRDGTYPAFYVFSLVKPSVSPTLTHEDDFLLATFSIPSNTENNPIAFKLKNKSENPVAIDWNQVSYVDVDGKAHKVVHEGTRLVDKDKPLPASIIPPGAALEDFVFPSDRVVLLGGQWIQQMLLPYAPAAEVLKGKTFSVFMPLEINGSKKNYNFVFAIDDIK